MGVRSWVLAGGSDADGAAAPCFAEDVGSDFAAQVLNVGAVCYVCPV